MTAETLTEESFDEVVLKQGRAALIDLWAPWCGPCRALSPLVEELAGEFSGRVTVGKVNTDENPGLAARYGVSAIPTLLFFNRGALVGRLVGVQSKAAVREKLEALRLPSGDWVPSKEGG